MNYEKIKNDLISEVRLTNSQAEVFLLVTLNGKMPVSQISKSLEISNLKFATQQHINNE